jgi:hypothetical protein
MDKIKPYEVIATKFQVSNETAKYFLNHVQKSFKVERPPHKLILEFIEDQNLEFLLTPYETAALMNEKGVWAFALITAPPMIEDEEDDLSGWDDKPTFRRRTPKR